jgi:hypothetical protein
MMKNLRHSREDHLHKPGKVVVRVSIPVAHQIGQVKDSRSRREPLPSGSSTIKIENRSEKISKKPKISVCTLFSNLDNILKVLMYPLGAFSIMTSFLFDFPGELLYC